MDLHKIIPENRFYSRITAESNKIQPKDIFPLAIFCTVLAVICAAAVKTAIQKDF